MSNQNVSPVTVKAGQIQFVEACYPPLVAGDYKVCLRQEIRDAEQAEDNWHPEPYTSALLFTVDAPRFSLKPGDIHSVYPPPNAEGRFDNALPHVVFTRRTLPWERLLNVPDKRLGWMAVLLLAEDELPIPEVKALPVISEEGDSLLLPCPAEDGGKGVVCPPQLKQQKSEEKEKLLSRYGKDEEHGKHEERCLTIDLPGHVFRNIVPGVADLPYLSHVRQVDTGDKEVLGINDRGWFSVVIGNRMPEAKKGHRAFLVSLEGWEEWLEGTGDTGESKQVRLAVLGTWRFTCTDSNDFKERMDSLNFGGDPPDPEARRQLPDSWLRLPSEPDAACDDASLEAEEVVRGAFSRGYTAFDHVMRHGERTVSWYRGPLVPLYHTKPEQIQKVVSCADELLRYDPTTGLFDISYAAAWQLGRLLALQNQSFALALNTVRRALRDKAERLLQRDYLKMKGDEPVEESLVQRIAHDLRAALDGRSSSSASQREGGSGGTATPVADRLVDEERAAVIRREVQSWLGRLVLLYGVPFRYLIPEEKMLPKESIRFFYLDPIWIQCLVQGACTVGNTSQSDVLIDQAINETVQPNQPERAERPGLANEAAAGIRSQLRNQCEGVPLPERNGTLHWPLTGFLLRSAVVDGWRGLEVMAYRKVESETEKGQLLRDKGLSKEQIEKLESDSVAPLAPLRIEQLSQDVMLGLFNGEIAQLVIRQPQEGLHFGLEPTDGLDAGYIKRLREFGYKCPKRAGEVLDEGEIDLSKGCLIRCNRVVAVGRLAGEMKRRLSDQSQLCNETFTSAEFGVQMIEAPGEFTFKPSQDAEG